MVGGRGGWEDKIVFFSYYAAQGQRHHLLQCGPEDTIHIDVNVSSAP